MTLCTYIEEMAFAQRRVVEAKGLIQSFEDLRLRLGQMGQIEAAEAAASRIEHLELHLKRLEVMQVVASYGVRNAVDAATAYDAPSALSRGAAPASFGV